MKKIIKLIVLIFLILYVVIDITMNLVNKSNDNNIEATVNLHENIPIQSPVASKKMVEVVVITNIVNIDEDIELKTTDDLANMTREESRKDVDKMLKDLHKQARALAVGRNRDPKEIILSYVDQAQRHNRTPEIEEFLENAVNLAEIYFADQPAMLQQIKYDIARSVEPEQRLDALLEFVYNADGEYESSASAIRDIVGIENEKYYKELKFSVILDTMQEFGYNVSTMLEAEAEREKFSEAEREKISNAIKKTLKQDDSTEWKNNRIMYYYDKYNFEKKPKYLREAGYKEID